MKNDGLLTLASLLSIVLFSIHVSLDIVRGISGGGLDNLFGILILVVWLCGTLLLADRRSGKVIMFVGGLFAAAMPVLHFRGRGVGGDFAKSSGAFLFIWTLYAIGATGALSAILSVRGLRRRSAAGPAVEHESPDRRG